MAPMVASRFMSLVSLLGSRQQHGIWGAAAWCHSEPGQVAAQHGGAARAQTVLSQAYVIAVAQHSNQVVQQELRALDITPGT